MKRLIKLAPLGLLLGGWMLSGFACDQAQINASVSAGCAVGQIAASTASLNAAALDKPGVASKITQAQTLAQSDCAAAQAAVAAAYAAAAAK